MSNQNLNPFDPAFWEAEGIKVVQIDLSTPQSTEQGMQELVQRVESEASQIKFRQEPTA